MCVLSAVAVCSFSDETRVGCDVCSAMLNSLYIERSTGPCKNSMADKFKESGCSEFHVKTVCAHSSNYHEGNLGKAQHTALYRRAAKTGETNEPGFYIFYFKDTGGFLVRNLEPDERCITNTWVIVAKQ